MSGVLPPGNQAVERAYPEADMTQKHRMRGRQSATTFLVECADADADDYLPVLTVMWRDHGDAIVVSEYELVAALKKLCPYGLLSPLRRLRPASFGPSPVACVLAVPPRAHPRRTASHIHLCPPFLVHIFVVFRRIVWQRLAFRR